MENTDEHKLLAGCILLLGGSSSFFSSSSFGVPIGYEVKAEHADEDRNTSSVGPNARFSIGEAALVLG